MPETIVPEAREIRAEAERLFFQPKPVRQTIHHLPKHYPVAQIEALLLKVMQFTRAAEIIGQEWEQHREAARRKMEDDTAFWDAAFAQQEAEEDGRLFLETCALEHSFQEILR